MIIAVVKEDAWFALSNEEICSILTDFKTDVMIDFVSKYNFEMGKLFDYNKVENMEVIESNESSTIYAIVESETNMNVIPPNDNTPESHNTPLIDTNIITYTDSPTNPTSSSELTPNITELTGVYANKIFLTGSFYCNIFF